MRKKRLLLIVSVIWFFMFLVFPIKLQVQAAVNPKTMNVLFVGNSFTRRNNLPGLFRKLKKPS
jgi:hypothetical protein